MRMKLGLTPMKFWMHEYEWSKHDSALTLHDVTLMLVSMVAWVQQNFVALSTIVFDMEEKMN